MSNYRQFGRTRNTRGFERPPIQVDWATCPTTHEGDLVVSGPRKGQRVVSSYRHHFLDHYGGSWALNHLKWDNPDQLPLIAAWTQAASLWFIHDDSISVLKTEHPLPITFSDPKVGKDDKRLSRLVGSTQFGAVLPMSGLDIKVVEVGPATQAAFDGMSVKIGRRAFERIATSTASTAPNETARREVKRVAHNVRQCLSGGEKVRIYVTILAPNGAYKGHALICQGLDCDIQVVKGTEKREIRLDRPGEIFVAFNMAHKSDLRLDVQTIAMHGGDGRFEDVPERAAEHFRQGLADIQGGKFAQRLERQFQALHEKKGLEAARSWWLLEYVASGGNVGWFTTTARAAIQTVLGEARSSHEAMRIPSPGEFRWYLATDVAYGTKVPRGQFRLIDESIIVNAVDYLTADNRFGSLHELNEFVRGGGKLEDLAPGLAAIWGDGDQDDQVAMHKYVKDGIERWQATRSPTFPGEIVEFVDGRIEWPAPIPVKFTGNANEAMEICGRTWREAMFAIKRLVDNGSAVGVAAKDCRYSILTEGALPAEMPAPMSTIVDWAVQEFRDVSGVTEFHRANTERLALQSWPGAPIPRAIADEVGKSLQAIPGADFRVAAEGESGYPGEWFDSLMDRYTAVLNKFLAEAEELLKQAYPPAEFLQAVEHADASASRLRKYYGEHFAGQFGDDSEPFAGPESIGDAVAREAERQAQKKFFEELAADCVAFLEQFEEIDRPDIVGAAVGIAYKRSAGAEITKDFIGFQRGEISRLMLTSLRKYGIIDEPVEDEFGNLVLKVAEDPEPPRWHVPLYGAWAYLNGVEPEHCSRAERESLLGTDYPDRLMGRVVACRMVTTRVRGKIVERWAAFDVETGAMVGTLPMAWNERDLPPAMQVVNSLDHDGALIVVCEPGELS